MIRDSNGAATQSGFTLKHVADTGLVSIQCSSRQLPKDTKKILSIDLKCHFVMTSETRPVASLYPDGKFLIHVKCIHTCTL